MNNRVLGQPARALLRLLVACVLGAAALPAAAQDEILVRVAQYGVGNSARAGDWMGVQVEITDPAPEQRDLVLRMSVRDADGDRAMYDRVVTTNPGVEQSFWLYARLPFQADHDPPGVTVFEALQSEDDREPGYRPGRLLARYDPPGSAGGLIVPASVGLAGVIGPYPAGLEQYNFTIQNRPAAPFGHELTRVATGLDVPRLPDRWHGLGAFEVLLWAESTTRITEPTALTPERAAALRRWVERGGHLVVLIPPAGDPWFGARHPLSDILPAVSRPERREGVDPESLRPLLTESANLPLPDRTVVHTFTPRAGAGPGEAQRVLNLPDGSCVVVRRVVGAGAVTVVGIDLAAGPLRRFGLPEVEAFWHRVLGRRGEVRGPDEITDVENAAAGAPRREMDFDHDLANAIARTGSAIQGVLFGLVVFITYWLVAGPVGFALLRRRGLHHHAWVAFAACTALFTALAWAGATALRPKRVSYTHLTLLETVHGQAESRARTWSSLMLPSYGLETVSVLGPDAERPLGAGDVLAPWEPPGNLTGWTKGFPDNSGYRVEARSPDTLTVPSRATVKQFRADHAGVTSWGGIGVQSDPGALDSARITREGLNLSGVLVHDFPAPLTDVRVFINPGQVRILPPGVPLGGAAISGVTVLAPQFGDRSWAPGEPLDLGAVSAAATSQTRTFDFFRSAVRVGSDTGAFTGATSAGDLQERLTAVRFLSQFAPPNYRDERDTVANRQARRFATHGWDLGRWMTTPCVIVTGFVEIARRDASPVGAPFPLFVDGRAAPASGLTMVTWIYPLPEDPPRWSGAGADLADPDDTTNDD